MKEQQPYEQPGHRDRCQSNRDVSIGALLHERIKAGKPVPAVDPNELENNQAGDQPPSDQGILKGSPHYHCL